MKRRMIYSTESSAIYTEKNWGRRASRQMVKVAQLQLFFFSFFVFKYFFIKKLSNLKLMEQWNIQLRHNVIAVGVLISHFFCILYHADKKLNSTQLV